MVSIFRSSAAANVAVGLILFNEVHVLGNSGDFGQNVETNIEKPRLLDMYQIFLNTFSELIWWRNEKS